MADMIADLNVLFLHPDGRCVAGCIWVGQPRKVDELEARCPVGLDGLHENLAEVAGNDTLQAMLLGVRLLANLLGEFQQRGGRVLDPQTDEPIDLEPYLGTLLRSPAAFLESELNWLRPDVTGIVTFAGLATVAPGEHLELRAWLQRHGYGFVSIDCSRGQQDVRRQLGEHLRWGDQFGYRLDEDGRGNLNAVRDGFSFDVPQPGGLVLELLEPEVVWHEDRGWFEGFLRIASEHSRYHLALGRRFLTLLVAGPSSPLLGKTFETLSVPHPVRAPGRQVQESDRSE